MMRRARRHARSILAAAAGLVLAASLALVPALAASAHDYLVGSDPAANSTVTTPLKTVTLTFNDVVLNLSQDGASSLLQVTGPNGASRHFESGCPTITDRQLSVPVSLGAPGSYLVTWQIVSADGHTVSDSLKFDYQPPVGTAQSQGTAARPACGRAQAASTRAPAATQQGTETPAVGADASGIIIGIAGVVVLIVIVAIVILIVTSKKKRGPGDGD